MIVYIAALTFSTFTLQADFGICTYDGDQYYSTPFHANSQFYAFWTDRRLLTDYCLYGARISETGTVLDPNGKELFRNQADGKPEVAYSGSNFLAVFRDSC